MTLAPRDVVHGATNCEREAWTSRTRGLNSGFRYALRDLLEVRPSMTEPDRPVVQATIEAVRRVLGRRPALVCSPGAYDQKHIDRINHLRDCIAHGPGILDRAHQPDEYVEIADMVASAKVMALAAHTLLTPA